MRHSQQMFNPALEEDKTLIDTMVEREMELGTIMDALSSMTEGGSARSFIIIGPRGMGKTHLLLVIKSLIQSKEDLRIRFVPVKFSEEEYSIDSLAFLFLRILQELESKELWDEHKDEIGSILKLSESLGDSEVIEKCDEYLESILNTKENKLVLLADNLDEILNNISNNDSEGVARLRSIMQTKEYLIIIGTAPTFFNRISDHEEPFFNFFEVIRLAPLSQDSVERLIIMLAEQDEESKILDNLEDLRPRIRTIVHFTSGIPRMVRMLYHVIAHTELAAVTEELNRLLDELTPYYQSRMAQLTRQQQKIIDTMASMEGPSTPTKIAKKGRMDRAVVNAQLKKLLDTGYVHRVKQKKRKTRRYDITERMFRIWREMRMDKEGNRVRYLAEFLRAYYTPSEIEWHVSGKLARCAEEGSPADIKRYIRECDFLKEVLSPERLVDFEMALIDTYIDMGELPKADEEMGYLRDLVEKTEIGMVDDERMFKLSRKRYEAALMNKPDDVENRLNYMILLSEQGQLVEALEQSDLIMKIDETNNKALLEKSWVLFKLERYSDALNTLSQYDGSTKPEVMRSMVIMAGCHYFMKSNEESLEILEQVETIDSNFPHTYYLKAAPLLELERYDEVLKNINRYLEMIPDDFKANRIRAIALLNLDMDVELEKAADRLIELDSNQEDGYILLALSRIDFDDIDGSIHRFKKIVDSFPESSLAYQTIANLSIYIGEYNKARENYINALKTNLDDDEIEMMLGLTELLDGKVDRFIEWFEGFEDKNALNESFLAETLWSEEHLKSLKIFLEATYEFKNEHPDFLQFWKVLARYIAHLYSMHSEWEIKNDNYGRSISYIIELLDLDYMHDEVDMDNLILKFLLLLASCDVKKSRDTYILISDKMDGEFTRRFQTFEKMLDYIESKNEEMLESLFPEEREIIEEMLAQLDEISTE